MHKFKTQFSKTDISLWTSSVIIIISFFLIFDKENFMTLFSSLLGVTSLILSAKGNPLGQLLMVIFSVLYGLISYKLSYYGEMITYMFMTLPMSVFALISWLKNPFSKSKAEVKVNSILTKKEISYMVISTVFVTFIFYYILKYFNTLNLIPSTISVTTSFLAVYLTYKRNPLFAIFYALNDIVLIILWILALSYDIRYISVLVCFCTFLINDIYGYICWSKMTKRQSEFSNHL